MRLFVAFDVPGRPGWHMTVVFLGEVEDPDPVADAVASALGPPAGPLEPRRLLELPRRHPRLLAVEYADPSGRCGALQAAVSDALVEAGLHQPERRRWLPHVSIARLRDEPVRPSLDGLGFTPEQLVLYRSLLGGGRPARHEALRTWPLAQS
ncbi:MAG: 2,3-cyclic 3-phosphodiesterase [Solirubrobacteraceae bacterium]|nr:2,3-cyclic 3-phosphodiesterase [Solirubrobacteraceae bacterium]